MLSQISELETHHFSRISIRDGARLEVTKDLFGSLDLGFVVLSHTDPTRVEADARRVRELEQQVVLDAAA